MPVYNKDRKKLIGTGPARSLLTALTDSPSRRKRSRKPQVCMIPGTLGKSLEGKTKMPQLLARVVSVLRIRKLGLSSIWTYYGPKFFVFWPKYPLKEPKRIQKSPSWVLILIILKVTSPDFEDSIQLKFWHGQGRHRFLLTLVDRRELLPTWKTSLLCVTVDFCRLLVSTQNEP